jgi:ATP-dependent Clp protease ATP-binding subunit ClpX
MPMIDFSTSGLRCSFCGKSASEVRSIVTGGVGFICDECVRSAVEMIAAEHPEWLQDLIAALDHEP